MKMIRRDSEDLVQDQITAEQQAFAKVHTALTQKQAKQRGGA